MLHYCYVLEQIPIISCIKMRFKFLDSITADAGFMSYGKTESELFNNASIALFSLMCDLKNVERLGPKTIHHRNPCGIVLHAWTLEVLEITCLKVKVEIAGVVLDVRLSVIRWDFSSRQKIEGGEPLLAVEDG